MAYSQMLLVTALAVVLVCVLPSLFLGADAKFTFSGVSADVFSRKAVDVGHHPAVGPSPYNPCIPIKYRGHHPYVGHHPGNVGGHPCKGKSGPGHAGPGKGRHHFPPPPKKGNHPPGVGHHPPGVGHHPPRFGVKPGHHPPGVGHHGKGHGHRCHKNATICLDPTYTAPGLTTCCYKKCVNILTDPNNCGGCYLKASNPGALCSSPKTHCCSGTCVDFDNDDNHCGSCNKVCSPTSHCQFGMCHYGSAPSPAPSP